MRKLSLPFELLASFARARAERAKELSSGTRKYIMFEPDHTLLAAPPRDPSQVPDGDLGDAIKPGNPTPSDFNDDDADELEDETDDDTFAAGDEDDED